MLQSGMLSGSSDMQALPMLDANVTFRQVSVANDETATESNRVSQINSNALASILNNDPVTTLPILSPNQNIRTNVTTSISSTNTGNLLHFIAPFKWPENVAKNIVIMSYEGDINGVVECISNGENINAVFKRPPATNLAQSASLKSVYVNELSLQNGDTALVAAIKRNHIDVAKLLLENGATIEVWSNLSQSTPWHGMTALMCACASRSTEMLDLLLINYRANIDAQNDSGTTALMYSCHNNYAAAAKYLITHGANTELKDKKGFDAMLSACTHCCDDIIDCLIENGVKVTPQYFFYAVQCGHLKLVQKFAALVGDINCQVEEPFNYLLQEDRKVASFMDLSGRMLASNNVKKGVVLGDTALIIAARKGNAAMVKLLLDAGIDTMIENSIKFNALITASEKNYSSVMELLLPPLSGLSTDAIQDKVAMKNMQLSGELLINATIHRNHNVILYYIAHGGDVNYVRAETQDTALSIGCEHNCFDVVDLLLRFNATVDAKSWQKAIKSRLVNLVKRFIEAGVDINQQYDYGKTALMQATYDGRLDMVQTLIAAGANVEMKNMFDMTALHMSFRYNNPKLTNLLLQAGADANVANSNDEIPLMEAIFYNNLPVINAIIERTTDINKQRYDGNTALMIAILQNCKLSTIQTLIGRGSDLNIQNCEGETALIIAARMGSSNNVVAKMLVRCPGFACINGQDGAGNTACTYASMNNNFELVKFLLQNNADASIGVTDPSSLFDGLKNDSHKQEALYIHRRESNWRNRKLFLMFLVENSYLLYGQNKDTPYTEKKYEKVLSNQNLVRDIVSYL